MVAESYELVDPSRDEVTLGGGDRDLARAIEKLTKRKFTVDEVFWDHAAEEVKNCCSRFVWLNPHLMHLAI